MSKPSAIQLGEEIYKAIPLKITDKDDMGMARAFEPIYEDEETMINGGEEFIIVYMREDFMQKPTRQ
jgi:hypothetical protein